MTVKPNRILLLVLAAALASCGGPTESLSRDSEGWPEESSSGSPSSKGESSETPSSHELSSEESVLSSAQPYSQETSSSEPEPSSSESSSVDTVDDLADDLSDFIPKYMKKMASLSSYKAVTSGSTKAKILFIETTQTIDVTSIKSDYCYLKNESHGAVDSVHEAYFHKNATVVKNQGESDFKELTRDQYLDSYGVDPYGYNIEGYSIRSEAVTSISKAEGEGHAFKLCFDPDKATNNVRIQMKAFGGLDDYPAFSKIEVTLHVAYDFAPIKYEVLAEYKAKRFGMETDCHQEYTVTFSSLNETIEIPGLAEVRGEFDF